MIDIVIAEDQTMLRDALATLLSLESDIAVAGTAATGREALDLVRCHEPGVLVTDEDGWPIEPSATAPSYIFTNSTIQSAWDMKIQRLVSRNVKSGILIDEIFMDQR